jgi:hypothetical protein
MYSYSNHSHLQTDELHTLVNTAVQMANVAETDLDRRFANLSHVLHARTRRAPGPPTQPAPTLSTFLPRRPADRQTRTTYFAPSHASKRRVRRTRSALRLAARRVRCSARRTRQRASGVSRSCRRRRPTHREGRVRLGEGDDIFFPISLGRVMLDLPPPPTYIFFHFISRSRLVVTLCSLCLHLSFVFVLILYVPMALGIISIWNQKCVRRVEDI